MIKLKTRKKRGQRGGSCYPEERFYVIKNEIIVCMTKHTHKVEMERREREHETDERSMTRNKLSYDGIVLCTLDEAGLSKWLSVKFIADC